MTPLALVGLMLVPAAFAGAPAAGANLGGGAASEATGILRIDVSVEKPNGLPAFGELEARSATKPGAKPHSVRCPRAGLQFRCELPVGELDVKLNVGSYAPSFFWNVELEEGKEKTLGPVPLVIGSAISGRIELSSSGGAPDRLDRVVVTLTPVFHGAVAHSADLSRGALRELRTHPDQRGFFAFAGVAAGEYLLTANCGQWHSQPFRIVVASGEADVAAPSLVLQPPLALNVTVEPPATPYGGSWRIEVIRRNDLSDFFVTAAEGLTNSEGNWRGSGLRAGEVEVSLSDEQGSTWVEEHVVLDGRDRDLVLSVALVEVLGSLSLGGEPLAGVLWFGGERRRPRIRMEADEKGRFSGYLPRGGEWALDLEIGRGVQAHPPLEIAANDRRARVAIDLPRTLVAGKAIDESGRAIGGAEVIAVNKDAHRREIQATTKNDGSFELSGISPGELQIHARSAGMTSDLVQLDVREDLESPPVTLVLTRMARLEGVVTAGGAPRGGVRVLAVSAASSGVRVARETVTRSDGRFELEVSARPTSVALIAGGLPLQLFPWSPGTTTAWMQWEMDGPAGELALDLAGLREQGIAAVDLVEHGASVSLIHLLRNGALFVEEREAVIPLVRAGEIAVCASGACASGRLEPFAKLRLSIPASR